jgi:hypothetical protein
MGLVFFPKEWSPKQKKRAIFWFLFFTVVFLANIWPLYLVANSATPFVLGMPFSMFWIILWIVIGFIGLLIMYRSEYGEKK